MTERGLNYIPDRQEFVFAEGFLDLKTFGFKL